MDKIDSLPGSLGEVAGRLEAGLRWARLHGLVRITEMGARATWYLDALDLLVQDRGALPIGVEIYVASGVAEQLGASRLAELASAANPWVCVSGVKFYADGWLGPRTCAVSEYFADVHNRGLLFQDADTLSRRMHPFADAGLRIATHAIGERAVGEVLDAYRLIYGDAASGARLAGARIEHASLLSEALIERIAESGVTVCVQPSFPETDAPQLEHALDPTRRAFAYPYRALVDDGVAVVTGSDYPIETIDPLVGLARLVNGRSRRQVAESNSRTPNSSRLDLHAAFDAMTDSNAGVTVLTDDPVKVGSRRLDGLAVTGCEPRPFR